MCKLDLFNKKKIKKLEQEVYSLNNDIEGYIKNERNWSKQIDNMEKISTKTMEENQKLINWIMKILDTVGTMEVREKSNFKIPVYEDKNYRAYEQNYMGIYEKERLTIPEITIVKMG